ncbi:MAG: aminoacyl-tRNA hydrolase, partial [bacterium]|nr:aminoacyl-tRNA hydrolase [bacterium]
MKLIVGLGNPGEKYIYTRHNIGFIILDALAKKLDVEFKKEDKFKSFLAELRSDPAELGLTLLVKPQTYMNLSGDSVRLVSDFYKIEPKDILVIHDDLDFEVGEL